MKMEQGVDGLLASGLMALGARLLARRRAERTSTTFTAMNDDDGVAESFVRDGRSVIEHLKAQWVVERLRVKLGMPSEVFEAAGRPVIERYAEFVQLLPAAGDIDERCTPSLLLQRTRAALRALDYRRGEILPRGAAPEVIGAQMHRWSYAVFLAALLYELDAGLCGVEVSLRFRDARVAIWDPLSGSMLALGALRYRIEPRDVCPVDTSRPIALRLQETLLPEAVRSWLGADPRLVDELHGLLAGDKRAGSGAIAELILRARFDACAKSEAAETNESPKPRSILEAGSPASASVPRPLVQTKARPADSCPASRPGASSPMATIAPDMRAVRSERPPGQPQFLEDFAGGHGIDVDSPDVVQVAMSAVVEGAGGPVALRSKPR